MNIKELYEEIKKLDNGDIHELLFTLITNKKISFAQLTQSYVQYLEKQEESNRKKESLMASCIATSIRKPTKNELSWNHSQAFVLIKDWLPNAWLNEYLHKRTEELIKKNEDLLRC